MSYFKLQIGFASCWEPRKKIVEAFSRFHKHNYTVMGRHAKQGGDKRFLSSLPLAQTTYSNKDTPVPMSCIVFPVEMLQKKWRRKIEINYVPCSLPFSLSFHYSVQHLGTSWAYKYMSCTSWLIAVDPPVLYNSISLWQLKFLAICDTACSLKYSVWHCRI